MTSMPKTSYLTVYHTSPWWREGHGGRVEVCSISRAPNQSRTNTQRKLKICNFEIRTGGSRQVVVLVYDWKMKLGLGGFGDGL